MALVTYDYKFSFIDVGCRGRISYGGVYANSKFCKKKMKSGEIRLPPTRYLPKPQDPAWQPYWGNQKLPFVIVGDNGKP